MLTKANKIQIHNENTKDISKDTTYYVIFFIYLFTTRRIKKVQYKKQRVDKLLLGVAPVPAITYQVSGKTKYADSEKML